MPGLEDFGKLNWSSSICCLFKEILKRETKKRFCPFTCCLQFFCCYFSLVLLLPHAKQEIQDGHNGYHSEAEPDQVASFTHLSFINYVARYYKLVLIECIQILFFSCKRSPRKHLACHWLCARQSFVVKRKM